ncbi:hypothetical protein [Aureimonas psammosilenae]|uniref:hypothetical protein n=1 Tax=Aureimonas psammosilenae TaxID=2495496 RepID=UPI0012608FA7|nr:hypothetical protein [Aureimonas psammosilenae]
MRQIIHDAFDVDVDQDLVVDGRSHAADLIERAYRLLMPYVNDCPACSDQMFSIIANQVIATIQVEEVSGVVKFLGEEADFQAAAAAHIERQQASTVRMLGTTQTHH